MTTTTRWSVGAAALFAACLLGCGNPGTSPTTSVSGTWTTTLTREWSDHPIDTNNNLVVEFDVSNLLPHLDNLDTVTSLQLQLDYYDLVPALVTGNAMTVDVEDYFQVSAFERHVAREDWDRIPARVEANTDRILAPALYRWNRRRDRRREAVGSSAEGRG